jgi:hypothetical protein
MKSILIFSLALFALPVSAAELPIPEEQAALAAIAEGLFDKPPEWSATKGPKTLVWSQKPRLIRVTLDPETGHVIDYFSNGIPVTDSRLTKLAACKELKSLAYDHSGRWQYKELSDADFSGAGYEAFADSKVESIKIGGSLCGEAGALAIAKMKSLKTLSLHHVPMTRPGMEALSNHGSQVSFSLSCMHQASWHDLLPLVAAMPKVEELTINETFLTWDKGLEALSKAAGPLKKINFGFGAAVFPEDLAKLKAALPTVEITTVPYDKLLHGSIAETYYAPRLKRLMTAEEYARLEQLAEAKP